MAPDGAWAGLVVAYMSSRTARRRLAVSSRNSYRSVLGDLARHLDVDPSEARAQDVADAVDRWLDHHGWAASTCCTNLGIVRPFLDWCASRGHLPAGVASLLANPRKRPPLPRAISAANVGVLLAHVPDSRGRVIVLLEGQCGLRRAEVAAARMCDLDLPDGTLLVRGKGDKERRAYLSEETLDAIRGWLIERGTLPGALVSAYSSPTRHMTPTWIGMLVARWMVDAGLKVAPRDGMSGHALRHTAATQMLRNGENIRVVQSALGHESITTTARYLRADDPEVRAAMRGLSYGSRRLRAVNDE